MNIFIYIVDSSVRAYIYGITDRSSCKILNYNSCKEKKSNGKVICNNVHPFVRAHILHIKSNKKDNISKEL